MNENFSSMSPLTCKHCGKSFSTIPNCQRHVREVCESKSNNGRVFECSDCNVKFMRRSVLARHIKMRHIRLREFECDGCSKMFSEKCDLLRHFNRMHTRSKENRSKVPHCEECLKNFSCNQSLKIHRMTFHRDQDSDERFTCSECSKEFGGEFYLKRHIKRIHQSERQKFLVCSYCSKKFRGKEDIRIHIRNVHLLNKSHSNIRKAFTYKCLKCDHQFDAASLIQDHYRNEHDICFEYEDLEFESIEKFELWKQRMNHSTTSQMKVAKKWETTDYSAIKYTCHRSGIRDSSDRLPKSSIKEARSKKLGGYCPMEIVVKIKKDNGSCCATFQKTHVGHRTSHEEELRYTKHYNRRKLKSKTKAIIDVSENIILAEQESNDYEEVSTELNRPTICHIDVEHFENPWKDQQIHLQSCVTENLNYVYLLKDVESSEEDRSIYSDVNGIGFYEKIVEIDGPENEQKVDGDFDLSSIEDIEVYEEIDYETETEFPSPKATSGNSPNRPGEEFGNHHQTSALLQMVSTTDVTEDDLNSVVDEFRRSLLGVRSKEELASVQKVFVEPLAPFLATHAINCADSSAKF